jgi:hypothetical protein
MGKIDDSLVKRYELKETIINELKGVNVASLTAPEVVKINKRLLNLSSRSPEILLEILVTSRELPGELVILLLDEMKHKKILNRVNELLKNPSLPDKTRAQLITLKALKEYGEKSAPESFNNKEAVGELLTATEMLWRELEDEEIGSLWLEGYWRMDRKDKKMLLEVFLKRGERFYLPVFRLEAESEDVEIVRQVARGLARFDDPLAAKILRRLMEHKDMGVRLDAEYSLKQYEAGRKKTPKPQVIEPSWEFYKAFVGEDPRSGQYTVVYSAVSPKGDIKFMNVWIDSWDRGIVDCWGNIRYTPDQLSEMIRTFNQPRAEAGTGSGKDDYARHREVEKDYAVFLIRKGLELTQNRGHKIPTELFVWWGMIEDEPYDPKEYHVAFGLNCVECGAEIRMGKRRHSMWVIGDGKAVCRRCIRKKKRCENCDAEIKDFSAAFVLFNAESSSVSVICSKCHSSLAKE